MAKIIDWLPKIIYRKIPEREGGREETPGAFVRDKDGQVQRRRSTELLRWCDTERLGLGIDIRLI